MHILHVKLRPRVCFLWKPAWDREDWWGVGLRGEGQAELVHVKKR